MKCAFCHKDIGERDRITLIERLPYHDDCLDYLRGHEEIGERPRPPEPPAAS